MQSFIRRNDCKSYFYFYFWSVCTNDCKSNFIYLFLECNRSHVRTIASQILFIYFWSAIICTYEQLQAMSYFIFGVRSEGMDRWSWSDAPHKNHLVMARDNSPLGQMLYCRKCLDLWMEQEYECSESCKHCEQCSMPQLGWGTARLMQNRQLP